MRMTVAPRDVKISKFLSYVLRHNPQKFGLELEPGGWVKVENLLAAANSAGIALTRDRLQTIVGRSDRPRFSFSADGRRIRANYGHSVPVDLQLAPVPPPEQLYHGTATRFLESIRKQGLLSRGRQFVHLSETPETASQVGRRHGTPVVLTIRAAEMHKNGWAFYQPAPGMWLTGYVPVEFIDFPDSE